MKPFFFPFILLVLFYSCKNEVTKTEKGILINEVCLGKNILINPDLGKSSSWLELKNYSDKKLNINGLTL